jgi:hypothetical protein
MAIRRVRIYPGNESQSNIIGFSRGASDAVDNPRFAQFLNDKEYDWVEPIELAENDTGWQYKAPEGSVSWRHVEVRPPLKEEHIKELGFLCVGGYTEDNRYIPGIVNPHHDGVMVLDNRHERPDRPMGTGRVVADDASRNLMPFETASNREGFHFAGYYYDGSEFGD